MGRNDWRDESVEDGGETMSNLDILFVNNPNNWHCVLLSTKSQVLPVKSVLPSLVKRESCS